MKPVASLVAVGLLTALTFAADETTPLSPAGLKARKDLRLASMLCDRRGLDLSDFDEATRKRLAAEMDAEIKIAAESLAAVDSHPDQVDAIIAAAHVKQEAVAQSARDIVSDPKNATLLQSLLKRGRREPALFAGPNVLPMLHTKSPLQGMLNKLNLTDAQRTKIAALRKTALEQVQAVADKFDKVADRELAEGRDYDSAVEQSEKDLVGLKTAEKFRSVLDGPQLNTWTAMLKADRLTPNPKT